VIKIFNQIAALVFMYSSLFLQLVQHHNIKLAVCSNPQTVECPTERVPVLRTLLLIAVFTLHLTASDTHSCTPTWSCDNTQEPASLQAIVLKCDREQLLKTVSLSNTM